ncbi:hypothetical protein CPLU01_07696 [Colletotrichum plurivorum]|uniref:Uncharacterized protein n=1 Tax=Colletotrichum plurivorum TaxID=2175906 RepID=A0A8H6KEZ1_9PEZI|nr:hypothetical protein CPLU01_07696 [Colletotrichum plurivorum]
MRDTPVGYHAPPDQLPPGITYHAAAATGTPSSPPSYSGSSSAPQLKRKPIPRISSATASELGVGYGPRTETVSTTSKRSLLRRAGTALPTSKHSWVLEGCAVALSIAALVAISVLLPLYNGRPLSSWSFRFSFNTVVSVLGATSRATLAFAVSACISQGKWNWFRRREDSIMVFDRFEEASRGPWGSMRLLWWSKLRHWIAVGAFATVILVGFEPFLQAIITFEGQEVSSTDPLARALIGRSSKLDVGSQVALTGAARMLGPPQTSQDGMVMVLSMRSTYDFGVLASVWSGFSNLSTAEGLTASYACPSGNCTWAPYASLAVCSACNDVSGHLSKTSGKTNVSSAEDKQLTTVYFHSTSYPIMMPQLQVGYVKHEIKELGMNISNVDSAGAAALREDGYNISNTFLAAKANSQPADTLSFKDFRTLIVSFAMMETSADFRANKTAWEDSQVTARECALYFCANAYRSDVKQGILKEEVLGSWAERNTDSFLASSPTYAAASKEYNAFSNYTLDYDEWDMQRTDLQLGIPAAAYQAATGEETKEDLRFNISQNAAGSITGLFMTEFARRASPLQTKQLVYPPDGAGDQPHVAAGLGASQNLTATFEAAAASMSKYVRDLSLRNGDPYEGEARQWVVHIQVRWGFLSLPVAALLGGCAFCVLSMAETRRLGLPAWRGSSLAGLAHGLDARAREQLREADDALQMDAHARRYNVRFVDSDMGPELKLSQPWVR